FRLRHGNTLSESNRGSGRQIARLIGPRCKRQGRFHRAKKDAERADALATRRTALPQASAFAFRATSFILIADPQKLDIRIVEEESPIGCPLAWVPIA